VAAKLFDLIEIEYDGGYQKLERVGGRERKD
jgi:hypothetical protein